MRFNSQQIISYFLDPRTQNLGLREVDLEHRPKRGRDKINMLKKRRKTKKKKKKSYHTAWTHIWIPALREVDLEPSAKKGTNRTKVLVSLNWSSCSLHFKELRNQISHKSTKVEPSRPSWTWRESDQISKSYALQHSKRNFPKTTRSNNAHDWSYKWGRHTQR